MTAGALGFSFACVLRLLSELFLWQEVQRSTLTLLLGYFKFWFTIVFKTSENSVTLKRNNEVLFEFLCQARWKIPLLPSATSSFECVGKALFFSDLLCFPLGWDFQGQEIQRTKEPQQPKQASAGTLRLATVHRGLFMTCGNSTDSPPALLAMFRLLSVLDAFDHRDPNVWDLFPVGNKKAKVTHQKSLPRLRNRVGH